MKRLGMLVVCGLCLFGCANSTEPIEDDVLVDATEGDLAEQERQAHIDEIRKSINGDQEEMTTEEYFEQQRKEKSQEAIASAHNWREYNDIIVHGFGDLTEQKEETKKPQKEEDYLDIEEGLTYDNFLLIGTDDFMTVEDINELLDCNGDLVSEYGSHTVYQWEFREKKSFKDVGKLKIVTVGFENGKAISKNQVGL